MDASEDVGSEPRSWQKWPLSRKRWPCPLREDAAGRQDGPSKPPSSPLLAASLIPAHRLNLIKEENDYIPEELGESESTTDRGQGHLSGI